MKVSFSSENPDLIKICQDILPMFFPGFELVQLAGDDNLNISFSAHTTGNCLRIKVLLTQGNKLYCVQKSSAQGEPGEDHNQAKRLLRLAFLKALELYSGRSAGPWGILAGIRPGKIAQRFLDAGWKGPYIVQALRKEYGLSAEKAGLLTEIAYRQRPYLLSRERAKKVVGIYIGIPFCPTRCAYCSFPAYAIDRWGFLIEPFLQALFKEITSIGQLIKENNLEVESIYIGGGTPTSLKAIQLQSLLELARCSLFSPETREFTVEAGRPDTLEGEKLLIMKTAGVTRLSINPQSMVDNTLQTIGRAHGSADIVRAVEEARDAGFSNINMDIIVGLPGETLANLEQTLAALEPLKPENLTVHTLAIKRASWLKANRLKVNFVDAGEGARMLGETYRFAREVLGMHPYYLYRQKQMISPLENVGFAREGYDCIYNIQMIEERQTILGLGAGAASKFVRAEDWTLESMYNPKDPQNYAERIDELIRRKVDKLNAIV